MLRGLPNSRSSIYQCHQANSQPFQILVKPDFLSCVSWPGFVATRVEWRQTGKETATGRIQGLEHGPGGGETVSSMVLMAHGLECWRTDGPAGNLRLRIRTCSGPLRRRGPLPCATVRT